MSERAEPIHRADPHDSAVHAKLNWLRAGVLGANDGIVSVAALVVGVAAATTDVAAILIAGVAAVVAGAISMGLGEYVSVSSQRDTERALIAKERHELDTMPEQELAELAGLYRAKGLSRRHRARPSPASSPRTTRSRRTSRWSCTSTRTTW